VAPRGPAPHSDGGRQEAEGSAVKARPKKIGLPEPGSAGRK